MKRLISMLLTAALLLSTAALPTAAAAGDSVKYQSKKLTAYLYDKDTKTEMTCLFRGDLPDIPYIGAVDYLNQLYTVEFTCEKNADGTYTVSDVNGEMIIDVDKDTIHFEDYETLAESDSRPYLEDETADYLSEDSEYEVIGELKALDLDLGAYGFDLTASGDMVYFPLPVINNLFAGTYHAALYLDGALYFIDVMADEDYYDSEELFVSTDRDRIAVDYSYRELCFVMDHFYGCPPKAELAQDIRDKGFDRAIEEYDDTTARAKELLLSDDLTDYLWGLLFLDMYMDDGGHTVLSYGLQLGLDRYPDSEFMKAFQNSMYDFSDNKLSAIYAYLMDQMDAQSANEDLEDYRKKQFRQFTEVKTWDLAAFYVSDKTGIFTFDEFKDEVVHDLKWSLDYAAENGVENFILDLSLNGGGSMAVAVYILSVICDYPRLDIINRVTGNRYYVKDTVDRNLDGSFDEKDDEVQYSFRFGVLTTQFSFSAANALACLMKYNGIAVLGENSGGGTCAVAVYHDAAGYRYAISDSSTMVNQDGENIDLGAKPDCPLPGRDKDYQGLYDVERINEGLESFYANRPDPTTATEPTVPDDPTAATDAPEANSAPATQGGEEDADDDAPILWYVLTGALALLVIAEIVMIFVFVRRKKNR